ncbi:non-homologous end-joining DNA ligase [candidate division KSB1 bacterium]|nr:non-homologous end-joining DNA ligase [candidate division KSB1 bacterium]
MSLLRFGKITVELSNEDKLLFPDAGITKGEAIEYYQKIADRMLLHLKDRPITLQRFPDGITGKGFYQHQAGDYFPEWIQRIEIEKKEGGTVEHVLCNNTATLVYLCNQGCVTPHVWLSRRDKLDYPDRLIFDLDPPPDKDFEPVRFAAKALHEFLSGRLELPSFVMTTGSRGVHVVVPLDSKSNFDEVRSFAQLVARSVENQYPNRLTTQVRKDKRGNRLFLDTARNAYGQTAVAAYSLRPKPYAPIATPLDWNELSDQKLHAQSFTIKNIFRRLGQKSDPWKKIGNKRYSLKKARQRLQEIKDEEPDSVLRTKSGRLS